MKFTDLISQMQDGKKINCFIGDMPCYWFPFEIRDGVVGYEYQVNTTLAGIQPPRISRGFEPGFPKAYINHDTWKVVG